MQRIISLAAFALSLFTILPALAAPDLPPNRITLDGKRYTAQVSLPDNKRVIFYGVSKGNLSQAMSVTFSAPQGAKLIASVAGLKGDAVGQLDKKNNFFPISLKTVKQAAKTNSCLEFAPGDSGTEIPPISRPESNSPLCDLFSEAELNALAETLSAVYGGQWSRAQVCGYLVANYFGGAEDCDPNDPECAVLMSPAMAAASYPYIPSQISIRYGVIHKNACASRNTKYLVRFEIDLTKVEAPTQTTADVAISANAFKFSGSKAATIKPESDGRYAPQPILLMAYLDTMCGQNLSLVRWKGNSIQKITPLKLGDLVFYRNWILTRSPIGRALTGGKGTFELSTSHAAYGVCFALAKRRQWANGF